MKPASLESLRERVREKDRELVQLLNERAALALDIGRIKHSEGIDIYDPAQERKVRDCILRFNQGPLPDDALQAIFREVIAVSRRLQAPLSAAYFGPEASFTHLAALSHFGEGSRLSPQPGISEVFDEVERQKVLCGVVPIENSLEGSVKQTLDRLVVTPLTIRAEIFLRIAHHLLSVGGALAGIRRIYSHPQALAQCRVWVRTNLPGAELIESGSTAKAAQQALTDPEGAAIGSAQAGRVYGLKTAAEGIEDNPSNTTRFIVIGKGKAGETTGRDKTSILFGATHTPGALYRALGMLAVEGINMSRIESHPAKTGPWQYLFFVDLEGHAADERTARCLEALKAHTTFTKVLGSYPRGDAP